MFDALAKSVDTLSVVSDCALAAAIDALPPSAALIEKLRTASPYSPKSPATPPTPIIFAADVADSPTALKSFDMSNKLSYVFPAISVWLSII